METVVQRPADPELNLLTQWGDPDSATRRKKAVIGTILVHLAVIAGLMAVPPNLVQPPERHETQHITLLEPLTQLTQKVPNRGKVSEEFEARLQVPKAAIHAPVAPPATTPKPQAPRPAVIPQAPAPKPAASAPALPEPPKLEASINKEPPKPDLPPVAQSPIPAPPQIQPAEKPKLSLDNVDQPGPTPLPGRGRIPIPRSSVSDAVRDIARAPGQGMVVGDAGASESGYGGITQSPVPGVPLANVELKFDPQGIDFRPYLIQLLATVKRNWMAVMPESAKLGRRGKVAIQFSIGRGGNVIKLVFAQNSGADALDRAAVAGISASSPFPPLPSEFKGDRIVLQLNFVYR